MKKSFWKDRKVFITGHTGFKGSWITIWLNMLGSKIMGYSLPPNTDPNLFNLSNLDKCIETEYNDIRNYDDLYKSINKFKPEIIIHMAAQPLVRLSYEFPLETYTTNVVGTANVLEAARKSKSVRSVLNVTSDKCYENTERESGYAEEERLGGRDPYSNSKACAELVTTSYRLSYMNEVNIGLASARAGNVIGGGDWSSDRLIPDILKAIKNNQTILIRNPGAVRPWQHVLEPIFGYLTLTEKLYMDPKGFSEGWNFGPYDEDAKSVEWIVNRMTKNYKEMKWKIDDNQNPHEANLLRLDISKANKKLDWKPKWNIDKALDQVMKWHDAYVKNENMLDICHQQIEDYINS